MAAKAVDIRGAIDRAAEAGETFSNLYYDTFDKRRHKISKLYSGNATVVWNGNLIKGGTEQFTEFYTNLPSSEHTIQTLDCQPVSEQAIPGQTTILVIVEGLIQFEGHKLRNFSQNFLLTVEGTVWKVASDCFRFVE